MIRLQATIASLAIGTAISGAGPATAENVLRFRGMDATAATMDPHAYATPENRGATEQVYEALLDVDSNLAIVPQLATAWKPLDPTTWEFELRPGVTFQDGTPFTAADVVFSIARARAKTSDIRAYVDGIAAVEAIDDHTVHITTTGPDPSLWLKLADVAIMSQAWAEQHGVTIPADFNRTRQETYASRHANGTGPFMVEAFEPRGDWVMVRNPDWWGNPEYPHNIDRVVHARKEGDAGNVAALLAGEIDLLQGPPYSAIDQIRRTPGLKLATRTKLLTNFFGIDQGNAELRSSDIDCPKDWGDDEIATCRGVAQQLGEIGIQVAINFLSTDEHEAKVYRDRQSDFYLDGSYMDPDSEGALRDLFYSQGQRNVTGYANPRVDELIEKIKTEMVTYARDAYLEEAWRIVTEDLVYLPIRHGVSVFAMRKDLDIPPDPWDVPRFRLARFKEEAKSAQQ